MDEATIKQIASAIAGQLPAPSIGLIVVQTALFAIAAAVGAFFGEYFKTKGKNLATKQDFEDLKEQLKANTELVERVKVEIGREDWAAREWTNLRRFKLEELLDRANASETNLNQTRREAIEGNVQLNDSALEALQTIQGLYLPELENEVAKLATSHRLYLQSCGTLGIAAINKRNNPELSAAYDAALSEVSNRFRETIAPSKALRAAARNLLGKIMKID